MEQNNRSKSNNQKSANDQSPASQNGQKQFNRRRPGRDKKGQSQNAGENNRNNHHHRDRNHKRNRHHNNNSNNNNNTNNVEKQQPQKAAEPILESGSSFGSFDLLQDEYFGYFTEPDANAAPKYTFTEEELDAILAEREPVVDDRPRTEIIGTRPKKLGKTDSREPTRSHRRYSSASATGRPYCDRGGYRAL